MMTGDFITTFNFNVLQTREGQGPMAEYKYWRERDAELSLLVEQLKQPMVVKILSHLQKAESTFYEVGHIRSTPYASHLYHIVVPNLLLVWTNKKTIFHINLLSL